MNLEITKQGAIIHITEQTIKEIYRDLIKFKEEHPDRQVVLIESEWSAYSFCINVENTPHTQESLGFKASPTFITKQEYLFGVNSETIKERKG